MQQYSRRRNIEVHGVAVTDKERLMSELEKIFTPTLDSVKLCTGWGVERVGYRQSISHFGTVKCATLVQRKKNTLSEDGIFVNENLAQYAIQVTWVTKVKVREISYEYAWSRNGKVFLKETKRKPAIRITLRRPNAAVMATRTFPSFQELHWFTEYVIVEENRCKHLELLHVNITFLRKHWKELMVHLTEIQHKHFDILVLTETRIDKTSCKTYTIYLYESYQYCSKGWRGGRILVFVKKELNSYQLSFQLTEAEVVPVKVSSKENTFVLCAIYRLSSSEFKFEFEFYWHSSQIML